MCFIRVEIALDKSLFKVGGMGMNVIELNNVSKKYKGFELKDINFSLPSGCIMGLIGENGDGKSTIIQLILDMISGDGGEIKIFNKDNHEASNLFMEDIGVVFDELSLPNDMTALQINTIMKNVYRNWNEDKYKEYLERFDVDTHKKLKRLSRGNKMKVSIAVALSHNPKLLILDEATGGLDPVARDDIIDIFMEFTRNENHSILMSSHIVSDLEKACDYVAFLHKGILIMCDEKDNLKDKYRIIKCSKDELGTIPENAIIGKKVSNYGVSAMVEASSVPEGMITENITLEDLFIYYVREEKCV